MAGQGQRAGLASLGELRAGDPERVGGHQTCEPGRGKEQRQGSGFCLSEGRHLDSGVWPAEMGQ